MEAIKFKRYYFYNDKLVDTKYWGLLQKERDSNKYTDNLTNPNSNFPFDRFCDCQFTGLFDINGSELFKGDIIKIKDPYFGMWSSNGAEVIFSNEYVGGWVISNGRNNLNLGTRQSFVLKIGNIYENPELLK